MARLVWIEDQPGGAVSPEVRTLLESGAPLFCGDAFVRDKLGDLPVRSVPAEGLPDDGILLVRGGGPKPLPPLDQLADVVRRLLGPGGCPWDQEQTHESLKKYLLEECYEVIDAIDSVSDPALREELGDLLLQPIMHAAMAERDGRFSIDDVVNEIVLKLVRRHPHVFGSVQAEDSETVLRNWDAIKRVEKGVAEQRSILEGVPRSMPSLLRAHEISKRAARSGFEWPNMEAVFDKLREEESELKAAIAKGDQEEIEAEIGDLLFTAVNLARWVNVEPEDALRQMLDRFCCRFAQMEGASQEPLEQLSPESWDELWNEAKRKEAQKSGRPDID